MKSKKRNRTKYLWYTIAIGCLIIFSLILLSSILNIGERLRKISIYLEIGFYVLIVLVVLLAIVRPIVIIVKSPSLSIITVENKNTNKAMITYKKVAKNIIKNNELPSDEVMMLTKYRKNEELLINLNYVFEHSIKNQINSLIISKAKVVMISTAICQSARFDMATTFTINLNMIKDIVQVCGFRPSMKNLSKLTIKVFGTALIAEGLENLTIDDVMPKTAMNAISEVPLLGKVLESVIQGAANALLTVRIGCIARRYLFSDGQVVTQEDIRRQAYKETLLLIPQVIAGTVSFFPKKVVKFFTDRMTKNDNGEVVVDGK
jgi:uncharacterized membrane protein YcjF (UPF0283 family)